MFDLKFIRDNPDAFDAAMKRRGLDPVSQDVIALDEDRRATQTELQDLQRKRNDSSKEIGQAKASGDNARAEEMIKQVADLKNEIQKLEDKDRELGERINDLLSALPNIVEDDVPDGNDEASNVEVRRFGEPDRWNNAPDHVDIGEKLGLMDFSTAAKMSGARFVLLRGQMARLERALAQFMLDTHTGEFGYVEMSPPLLVRDNAVYGTGQLPKFHEDLFHTNSGHWLIPTAEVSLTNTVADMILDAEELPLRMTAFTPCFRSEAGSAGKDTRGMIRQHQFYKVELVSVTTPDESADELDRMTNCAEEILRRLELPFRTIVKCIGDTGFSARKSYDLEVWLPGQNTYREISSCSNCGDFQARRMKTRYRPEGQKGTQHVHTLNGSGVAVGRALVAVLENYHQADGSVIIPDVLKPYMGGLEKIEPSAQSTSDTGLAANA